MNNKKISFKNYLFIGSMLFGLFFGAGNLIFPVSLGQNAGSNTFVSNLGFLITAAGLPFLGILAIGVTNSNGVYDLSSRVSKKFANIFTFLLYLSVGPLCALPRLAAVSYEIGISPFVPKNIQKFGLVLYSLMFFCLTYFLSIKPSRLLEYVGKYLNPAFLIFLGILLLIAFVNPLGSVFSGAVSEKYIKAPFIQGFTDGYNMLDILASIAYGTLVIGALKSLGIKNPKEITKGTLKSGLIVVILMSIIYTALAFTGVMSIGKFKPAINGGIALAQISNHYLGGFGGILLAIIAILATLKTSIGMTSSIGKVTCEYNKKIPYKPTIIVISAISMIFANIGLEKILKLSIPILMFIHPIAIVIIFLALLEPIMGYRKPVYVTTTLFAGISAFFDTLNAAPDNFKNLSIIANILNIGNNLPMFEYGLGWLIPSIIGFIFSYLISIKQKRVMI